MRLAGDQQHAQLVAHAIDRDHGAVVHLGELAASGEGLDLDDVRPGMRDRDVDALRRADGDGAASRSTSPSRRTVTSAVVAAAPWSSTG